MERKQQVFIINGSASRDSSNQRLIDRFISLSKDKFETEAFPDLKILPHFDPELSITNTPEVVRSFRASIENADAVLICTPEYVFSIPGALKNAIEWCVSTTVFSNKPVALITASAHGAKAHEELKLIMRTLMAEVLEQTSLLISGIKGKIDKEGNFTDPKTEGEFERFIDLFVGNLFPEN